MTRLAAAVLLLALGSLTARAETLPDFIKAMLGEWLVVTDDGKPGCRITLESGRTIGGYVAIPARDCASRNPKLANASAWDFESGIRLRDPSRRLLYTFAEDETTVMKTRGDTVPVTLVVQAKPGVDRAPFAPDLYGIWAMKRPGGPVLCEVSLARTPSKGGAESFALKTGTPCDPAVTRLKLASWRIEDFALMVYGEAGASLRFEPSADGFSKAEGGKPLSLVRVR